MFDYQDQRASGSFARPIFAAMPTLNGLQQHSPQVHSPKNALAAANSLQHQMWSQQQQQAFASLASSNSLTSGIYNGQYGVQLSPVSGCASSLGQITNAQNSRFGGHKNGQIPIRGYYRQSRLSPNYNPMNVASEQSLINSFGELRLQVSVYLKLVNSLN